MLTICIPVFNFNITSLVNELSNQARLLQIPYEIIVIDDCSANFRDINKKSCEQFTYIEQHENIGRTRIRNLFVQYATYNYLLFLDCDSLIDTPDFILKYVEVIKQNLSVVCGGRVYEKHKPKKNKMLRWKYGIFKESQPYAIRQQFPYKWFMTNNFLISKKILEEIPFDERINLYGYEDLVFALALKKKNIPVTHINNSVLNGHLETNSEYLSKTKEAMMNLAHILNLSEQPQELIHNITLLKFYNKIKKIKNFVTLPFVVLRPGIEFLLTKGYISLGLFNYYKLCIFMKALNNIPQHSSAVNSFQRKNTL